MTEYIEKYHVLKLLGVFNDRVHGDYHFMNGIETAKEIVEDAPSADVQPVVHGEWEDEGFYADGSAKHAFNCSNCGHHIIEWKDDTSNYCPNCGARMDGGK